MALVFAYLGGVCFPKELDAEGNPRAVGGDRLRHSKFVGLREDKNPRSVVKEDAGEG